VSDFQRAANEDAAKESSKHSPLLQLLDKDPDIAVRKYDNLRRELISRVKKKHPELRDKPSDAEDLVSEAFVRISKTLANIEAYMYGIVKRIIEEERKKPRPQLSLDGLREEFDFEYGETGLDPSFKIAFDQCLERIDPPNRDYFRSYCGMDPTHPKETRAELAERAGISIEALRERMHVVRKKMKDCLMPFILRDKG
jgi:RNA polymerase sigma factor (sigma-70 family)